MYVRMDVRMRHRSHSCTRQRLYFYQATVTYEVLCDRIPKVLAVAWKLSGNKRVRALKHHTEGLCETANALGTAITHQTVGSAFQLGLFHSRLELRATRGLSSSLSNRYEGETASNVDRTRMCWVCE
jgi:hypothetical protein